MPAPQPKDPLDDPIDRFVTAVNEFLAMKADVDPLPEQPRTQNPFEDFMRGWAEFKRHIRRCHEAMVGAQPEADERLQVIVSVGAEIVDLTDDPYILGPVENLVRLACEERAEIGNIIPRLASATSLPTVLFLIGELLGLGSRTAIRREEIANALDSLTAYFLLRMPPRDSA